MCQRNVYNSLSISPSFVNVENLSLGKRERVDVGPDQDALDSATLDFATATLHTSWTVCARDDGLNVSRSIRREH